MALEVQGKIHEIYETAQVTDKFKKREFIIEMDDNGYTQFIKFQLNQERCSLIDSFKKGEAVKVAFNLSGRPFTGKTGETLYFTNLVAWKLDSQGVSERADEIPQGMEPFTPVPDAAADDLPF